MNRLSRSQRLIQVTLQMKPAANIPYRGRCQWKGKKKTDRQLGIQLQRKEAARESNRLAMHRATYGKKFFKYHFFFKEPFL